ncbi:hypothetical protein GCM10008931_44270 [Oceanobacillus oncorhynchi subsp. oncorhynchi]|uniref:hypothetical protein n=1 Tax=Oceanobacillus oncorhynchi TaxID=545501 RepID=UPI0031D1AAED
MDKLLEDIKKGQEFRKGEGWEKTITTDDIDYIIQQAGKVPELERKLSISNTKMNQFHWEKRNYEKALEEIRNEASSYMGNSAANRSYHIADKALKGETK